MGQETKSRTHVILTQLKIMAAKRAGDERSKADRVAEL